MSSWKNVMKYLTKSFWVWREAFRMLNEIRCFTYNDNGKVIYQTVHLLRHNRERHRKRIAYRLAKDDGFKQHPDHYWHESKNIMIQEYKRLRITAFRL